MRYYKDERMTGPGKEKRKNAQKKKPTKMNL